MDWPQNLPVVCNVSCVGEFAFVLNNGTQKNAPVKFRSSCTNTKSELIITGNSNTM